MINKFDELVSVIVPLHNSEKTISAALDSVLFQTYDKWELLIIDDGSTDTSPKIIDTYSLKDNRIRVFHISKSGVCAARNVGLENSNGQYVVFLDADDELTEDSIRIRVELIKHSDLGIANYIKSKDKDILICNDSSWDKKTTLKNFINGQDWGYQGYLWNKIFVNDLIKSNHIRFLDGIVFNEDRLFCFAYAQYINNTNISNEIVYKYIQNESSITNELNDYTDDEYSSFVTEFSAFDEMKHINADYSDLIDWQIYYRAFLLRDIIGVRSKKIHSFLKKTIRRTGLRLVFSRNTKFINRLVLVKRIIILKPGYIQ